MIHSISLITPRGNTLSIKAAGSGQPLFLLHGFPLDHRMWLPQIEQLSQHYHVIAPEFRGFGGSTLDGDYSFADLADDLELVRKHLAPTQDIDMVGLSMGGYIAFEYWSRYRANLRSLVLANTKPTVDADAAKAGRLAMAQQALAEGSWKATRPMLDRLIAPAAKGTAVEEAMRAMMESAAPAAVAAAQHAMIARRDFSDQLPSIKLPTLVITGEHDPIAPPEQTRQWSDRIPNSTFVEIAGSGHMTTLEATQEFNRLLLQFLNQVQP